MFFPIGEEALWHMILEMQSVAMFEDLVRTRKLLYLFECRLLSMVFINTNAITTLLFIGEAISFKVSPKLMSKGITINRLMPHTY